MEAEGWRWGEREREREHAGTWEKEGEREVGRCYAVGLEDGRGVMSHTLQVAS